MVVVGLVCLAGSQARIVYPAALPSFGGGEPEGLATLSTVELMKHDVDLFRRFVGHLLPKQYKPVIVRISNPREFAV